MFDALNLLFFLFFLKHRTLVVLFLTRLLDGPCHFFSFFRFEHAAYTLFEDAFKLFRLIFIFSYLAKWCFQKQLYLYFTIFLQKKIFFLDHFSQAFETVNFGILNFRWHILLSLFFLHIDICTFHQLIKFRFFHEGSRKFMKVRKGLIKGMILLEKV